MARIKSALEIALERTDSVKGDKKGLETFNLKQEGKKLAGQFLEDPEGKPLKASIAARAKDEQRAIQRGALDILLSQLSIPAVKEDLSRLALVGQGLQAVLGSKEFDRLFDQLSGAMDKYLAESAQYDAAIRKQYAPKLRQKEEELARRTGRPVTLDPLQDPEFVAFHNQNMGALKERYQGAIEQVRDQANAVFGED